MEDKINLALAQLENDLQSLVSAREQVENTVKASNSLIIVVKEYVDSVTELCKSLKEWGSDLQARENALGQELSKAISNMQQACSEIITSFNSKVCNSIATFDKGTKETLEKFTEQNNKLCDRLKELEEFNKLIKKINDEVENIKTDIQNKSQEIKESHTNQDIALSEIKRIVSSIPNAIQNESYAISQAILRIENTLQNIANQIDRKLDTINHKLDALAVQIYNIATQCSNITQAISSSTDSLKNTFNESKEAIMKSVKINRWLTIAAFIILAVLHYIVK